MPRTLEKQEWQKFGPLARASSSEKRKQSCEFPFSSFFFYIHDNFSAIRRKFCFVFFPVVSFFFSIFFRVSLCNLFLTLNSFFEQRVTLNVSLIFQSISFSIFIYFLYFSFICLFFTIFLYDATNTSFPFILFMTLFSLIRQQKKVRLADTKPHLRKNKQTKTE